MKTIITLAIVVSMSVTTVSIAQKPAQTTTNSSEGAGKKNQQAGTTTSSQQRDVKKPAKPESQTKTASGAEPGRQANPKADGQLPATPSNPPKAGTRTAGEGSAEGQQSSTRPGGATHENANDVGRFSDKEDSKSFLNSKEAIERRQKNLTEPDTTMKKGSGSAPKNRKNHTGRTGNYQNEASKSSRVP